MDWLKVVLSGFCGQNPLHSFFINGKQLFLCARCSGIYWGVISFYILYLIKRIIPKKTIFYFVLALFINLIYFIFRIAFLFPYNKITVFSLGLFLGIFFGSAILYNLNVERGYIDILEFISLYLFAFVLYIVIVFIFKLFFVINIIFFITLFITAFLIFLGILRNGLNIYGIKLYIITFILSSIFVFYKLILKLLNV